jgi:single-strand DNA-binding protein
VSEGLNKVMLIGNLGMDPELKQGASGAVLRLRMATAERWIDKSGERQERTEWHTVIFFGNRAEGLAKHLEKGSRVYVEGRLQTREWEKDGAKRYSTEVVGTQLLFLGGGREGGERSSGAKHREERRPAAARDDGPDGFGDDEIPF